MNHRRRAWRAMVLLTAVVLAGCSGIANLNIPTPPSTVGGNQTSTTVISDLSGVALAPVASTPPTTVTLTPGAASLSGIVTGPLGVVGGATVLLERLVGDSVGSKTVATQADGTFKVTGIRGGRYRIRAWHSPDLALTTPQILLLGAADNQNLNLILMSYNGQNATATVSPTPPAVGQVATVVVQVTQQTVGGDGVVRGAPLSGANVLVFAAGNVVLAGTNPGTTDAGGRLALSLGCASIGPVGLSATVNGLTTFPLTVADCVDFVPPVVTTPTTLKPPTSSVP